MADVDLTGAPLVEKVLEHAGVKGMRWGIRKDRPGVIGRTAGSTDHKRSREIRRKSVMDMSNDDLKDVIKRLELEKKYRDLNPSVLQRGQRLVTTALGYGTTANSAVTFYRSEAARPVRSRIERAIAQRKNK